jgi:tetratricopeptide (TPR) repeat protein
MAYTSEIEKLERRWKENPQGTVFAPLAEVYRKDGQLERAREVLRQGLEHSPNHIPGNIVLARCCLDLKEDGAAEAAFAHVLELDPENVIALKALGEITERQGRLAESFDWLTRLVQVDPSNDEARDQLKRVNATRDQAALMMSQQPAEAVAAAGEIITEESPIVPGELAQPEQVMTIEREGASAAAEQHVRDVETTLVVPAVADAPTQEMEPPSVAAEPGVFSVERTPPFEESDLLPSADAGAGSSYQASDFDLGIPHGNPAEGPPSAGAGVSDLGVEVFPLSTEEPAHIDLQSAGVSEFQAPDDAGDMLAMSSSGVSEFQVPDAAQELGLRGSASNEFQPPSGTEELAAVSDSGAEIQPNDDPAPAVAAADIEEPAPEDVMAAAPPVATAPSVQTPVPPTVAEQPLPLIFPDEAEREEPPRTRRLSQPDEVSASEPAVAEPEPVVTESMAEMYARQGLTDDALRVYRALAEKAPGDSRLADRIRELAAMAAPGEVAAARWQSLSATATGGESVESFFMTLVSVRPSAPGAGGPGAETPRAPTLVREGDDQSQGAPTRPASDPLSLSAIFGEDAAPPPPATPPPTPSASTPTTGHAFSFDQFFGTKEPGGGPSSSSTRSSQASGLEEDLDQFQNWLKSLKK